MDELKLPASVEASASQGGQSTIQAKQLQRYYTVLRDFMSHFHSKETIYPPQHEVRLSILYLVHVKIIILILILT